MARPWNTWEKISSADGLLELRQRGERDFLIVKDGLVLMNSAASRSEEELGRLAGEAVAGRAAPRVLIGGLGMGLTLRAALDALPPRAVVVVAELNEAVVNWCRGPLAALTERAAADPRVSVVISDVAKMIADASRGAMQRFDAVVIDLYEGPGSKTDAVRDPFYGSLALATTGKALVPGGVFAVWGEQPDAGFEKRLAAAGFTFERHRPGRGGLRHVVYISTNR